MMSVYFQVMVLEKARWVKLPQLRYYSKAEANDVAFELNKRGRSAVVKKEYA